ncbi:hypothetical protein IE53DRAFT_368629 [Violaceomyces palustris]|uniref:Uncharacterized protein n=1 Tax=Violaceomyces palustris TaxID=1673888 RepID=A0ACD0NYG2_9BASI|nr:hypothetical protein IE53DRAFT_368629 [Violaceomyces palustris]
MVENTPNSTVTIPNVVASHLIGQRSMQLGRGNLTLQLTPESLEKAKAEHHSHTSLLARRGSKSSAHREPTVVDPFAPILILSVGSASWPLYSSTLVGVHDTDERIYTFLAEVEPSVKSSLESRASSLSSPPATESGPTSEWIKVTLPAAVYAHKSPVQQGRDRLEKVLIQHGLLKDGPDEVAKGAKESCAPGAQDVKEALESSHPSKYPPEFSPRIHTRPSRAGGKEAGAHPHSAASAVSDFTAHAGAYFSKGFASVGSALGLGGRSPSQDRSTARRPSHEGKGILPVAS